MRKLRRNPWAMAAMAVLLLLATSGVGLSRMTCLSSGRTVISLGKADDCCPPEEEQGMALAPACCSYTEAGGERAQALPCITSDDLLIALPALPVSGTACAPLLRPAPSWQPTRPPPLGAPERLSRIRVLLI